MLPEEKRADVASRSPLTRARANLREGRRDESQRCHNDPLSGTPIAINQRAGYTSRGARDSLAFFRSLSGKARDDVDIAPSRALSVADYSRISTADADLLRYRTKRQNVWEPRAKLTPEFPRARERALLALSRRAISQRDTNGGSLSSRHVIA